MTSKMTKEDRRREWAKLAVKASEQTGEPLPQDFYECTGIRPPKSNSFRAYVNRASRKRVSLTGNDAKLPGHRQSGCGHPGP